MRTIVLATMLLAVGACDSPETRSEPIATNGVSENYTEQVLALPDKLRNPTFFRAIRDAGLPCQTVTRSQQMETNKQGPVWKATCEDGSEYLIQVTPDGTVNIVSRPTAKQK